MAEYSREFMDELYSEYYGGYEEGSAVRDYAVPDMEPEYEQQPEVRREPKRAPQTRRKNVLDLKCMMTVSVACAILLFSAISYLRQDAKVNATRSEIATLQTELSSIKSENVAKEEEINNAMDLGEIQSIATDKLGMVYADSNHTIIYQPADPDYVKQYTSIPKSK